MNESKQTKRKKSQADAARILTCDTWQLKILSILEGKKILLIQVNPLKMFSSKKDKSYQKLSAIKFVTLF